MLEYLICSTRPVRLPALPAARQGRKSFHLFVRLYAGGGLMDAGRDFCPLPKGARPPREDSSHPLLSGDRGDLAQQLFRQRQFDIVLLL